MSARKPLGVATCADQIAAILDGADERIGLARVEAGVAMGVRIQSEILKLAKLVPAAERNKIAPVLAAMGRELGGFAVEEAVEPVVLFDGETEEPDEVPERLREPLSAERLAIAKGGR